MEVQSAQPALAVGKSPWGFWPGLRRRERANGIRHVAHYERVLGTSLELTLWADNRDAASRAEDGALAEIERLEAIFSAFRPDSEFRRWQRVPVGEAVAVSDELAAVLDSAETWRIRSGGAFHPGTQALTERWAGAAQRGVLPDSSALAALVVEMNAPTCAVDRGAGTALRLTELPLTLNAIAKGFIIDRACAVCRAMPGIAAAIVNIGGDLTHAGPAASTRVAIADPFNDAENAAPVAVIRLQNAAVATSGNYRRGVIVGERHYSHLINPRSGRPVERVVSASVIAGDAMTADALATAFSVLSPDESLALAQIVPDIGVLLIADDGTRVKNAIWERHEKFPDRTDRTGKKENV